jgi:hypothetical protein
MALKLSVAARNAILDTITTSVGSAGLCRIYSGTRPASVATALAGNTLLAELTLGSPLAPSASSGVLTLNAITQDSAADATGTASFFRIFRSDGTTAVIDGDVAVSGSDMNMNTVSIVTGGPVQITSFTITAPGA